MSESYQYLPGCSLHCLAREYTQSFESVAQQLGLAVRELRDWNCCGATAARSLDEFLSLVLAARNLALAQEARALLVPCSLCYNNLMWAQRALQDMTTRERVNAALRPLGLVYSAGVDVRHPLHVLVRDIGFDTIAARVTHPLRGLRVVSYYGCLLTRPRAVALPESDVNPVWLDQLAQALGATALPFAAKTQCCGGSLVLTHPDEALGAAKRVLDAARDVDAQCIIVACPLCHLSLGEKQSTIEKRYARQYNLRVVYFTQLLGAALGLNYA